MIEYEEEYEEIIYEEEPEDGSRDELEEVEELADMSNIRAAMLKSANRFKLIVDDTGPEYKLSSIEFRIKHEPTEEPTGPFEGRLDPISLLLVTVLITSILLLFGIITMLFNRRKRLQKKHFHVDT